MKLKNHIETKHDKQYRGMRKLTAHAFVCVRVWYCQYKAGYVLPMHTGDGHCTYWEAMLVKLSLKFNDIVHVER